MGGRTACCPSGPAARRRLVHPQPGARLDGDGVHADGGQRLQLLADALGALVQVLQHVAVEGRAGDGAVVHVAAQLRRLCRQLRGEHLQPVLEPAQRLAHGRRRGGHSAGVRAWGAGSGEAQT